MPESPLSSSADLRRLQDLTARLAQATGLPLDVIGGPEAGRAWIERRSVCHDFHRTHPETAERCLRHLEELSLGPAKDGSIAASCTDGLWDLAVPITIAPDETAVVCVGPFRYDDEPLDEAFHRDQAARLGFPPDLYLEALRTHPTFSRQRVQEIRNTCVTLCALISEQTARIGSLFREVQEKRLALEELRNSLDLLTTLINTIPNPVYFQDRAGVILGCNTAFAETIMGLDAAEIIGRTITDLRSNIAHSMAAACTERDRTLIDNPGTLTYEGQITCGNGQLRDFLINKGTFLGGSGEVAGIIGVLLDITDRKRVEENLKRANEAAEAANRDLARAIEHANALAAQAESANRTKDEFLANMSHELRTPLNGVIGMASMLEESPLDDAQRSHVRIIQECGHVLLTLVDELLDYSRIEANKLDLQHLDFDLRVTLDELRATLQKRAADKQLEFLMLVSPRVPTLVRGDPGRLRQILLHLAGNGIKFTDRGNVVVRVGLELETEMAVLVRISVSDTGIGIPRDRLDRIFQVFTQLDGSTTRRHGGIGMGLALAKRLVEAQGGRIGADSEPEKGSTFWFTVRLEKQNDERRTDAAGLVDVRGTRVLIVDPSIPSREILTLQLKQSGCRPRTAQSGGEALALLRQAAHAELDPYQIIITEKGLPDISGLELGQAVREDPELEDAALVLLTAEGRRGDAAAVQEIGFAAYLTKPASRDALIQCLETVAAQRLLPPEAPRALITKYTLEEKRRRRVRLLVAETTGGKQRALLHALQRFGYSADCVADWEEAKEALRAHDYSLVLMDCQIPPTGAVGSGDDLRRLLGVDERMPMIAVTSSSAEGEAARSVADAMNASIRRPVDPTLLADLVSRLLAQSEQQPRSGIDDLRAA